MFNVSSVFDQARSAAYIKKGSIRIHRGLSGELTGRSTMTGDG